MEDLRQKSKMQNGNYLVSACVKKIRADKQKQHILGTPEWTKASRKAIGSGDNPKSAFYKNVDPQKIVDKYSGTVKAEYTSQSLYPREFINMGKKIGVTYDKKVGKYVSTDTVEIVYSKKGVHIFPVLPKKKVKK